MKRLVPLVFLPIALLLSIVGPAATAPSQTNANPDSRSGQASSDGANSPNSDNSTKTTAATGFAALIQTFYPFVEQGFDRGVSALEQLTLFLRSDTPDPVPLAGRPQDIWEFNPATGRFTQLSSDGRSTSPLPGAAGTLSFLRDGTIAIRPGPNAEPRLVPTSADPFHRLLGWNIDAGWF